MSLVEAAEETSDEVVLRVRKPSMRHLDEFIRLDCAPRLLSEKLFPNAKEVTESMAALSALRKVFGQEIFRDESVLALDVGCGKVPRTAALLAFMTRWKSLAIDPELDLDRPLTIERVERRKGKMESEVVRHDGLVVAVLVHAHVKPRKVIRFVECRELVIVGLPCCVPMDLPAEEAELLLDREDFGIWSPSRRVLVWKIRK